MDGEESGAEGVGQTRDHGTVLDFFGENDDTRGLGIDVGDDEVFVEDHFAGAGAGFVRWAGGAVPGGPAGEGTEADLRGRPRAVGLMDSSKVMGLAVGRIAVGTGREVVVGGSAGSGADCAGGRVSGALPRRRYGGRGGFGAKLAEATLGGLTDAYELVGVREDGAEFGDGFGDGF